MIDKLQCGSGGMEVNAAVKESEEKAQCLLFPEAACFNNLKGAVFFKKELFYGRD